MKRMMGKYRASCGHLLIPLKEQDDEKKKAVA